MHSARTNRQDIIYIYKVMKVIKRGFEAEK